MNRMASRAAITASVGAAFFASGGLNAGHARGDRLGAGQGHGAGGERPQQQQDRDRLGRVLDLAASVAAVRRALAQDEDPERAHGDHEQAPSR